MMELNFKETGLYQKKITLSRRRGIINRIIKRKIRMENINKKRAERKKARQLRG